MKKILPGNVPQELFASVLRPWKYTASHDRFVFLVRDKDKKHWLLSLIFCKEIHVRAGQVLHTPQVLDVGDGFISLEDATCKFKIVCKEANLTEPDPQYSFVDNASEDKGNDS